MRNCILGLFILVISSGAFAAMGEVKVTPGPMGVQTIIKGAAAEVLFKNLENAGFSNTSQNTKTIVLVGESISCRLDYDRQMDDAGARFESIESFTCVINMVTHGKLVPGNPKANF